MRSDVNWRAPARLVLRKSFLAQDNAEIGRGDLAEVIALATVQPSAQRDRLFVRCEANELELRWPHIEELAGRADFPYFI